MQRNLSLLAGTVTPLKRVEKPAPAPSAQELRIAELEGQVKAVQAELDTERAARQASDDKLQAEAVARAEIEGRLATERAVRERCESEVADLRARLDEVTGNYEAAIGRQQDEAVAHARTAARLAAVEEALQAERRRKPEKKAAPAPVEPAQPPGELEVVVERNQLDQVVRMHVKRKGE